jgi:hypothetical protein
MHCVGLRGNPALFNWRIIMRNTHFPMLKDVGTLTIKGTEWRLQEYYPNPSMRNYKFITAYSIKLSEKATFASDKAFEQWLEKMQTPVQQHLAF